MPLPKITVDDQNTGTPRQPVPLRFACLVTGLSFYHFLGLLIVRMHDRYERLTAYEYRTGAEPGVVRPDFFACLDKGASADLIHKDLVAQLPPNHFVWSDELAAAFSDLVMEEIGQEAANAEGRGLEWNPAFCGLDALLAECVDLKDLSDAASASALSRKAIRKQEMAESWALDEVIERWHALFSGIPLSQRYLQGVALCEAELMPSSRRLWRCGVNA